MDSDKNINSHGEHDDANRDPISGQPGAHPVGTGLGAAGAGTVGAVVGGAIGGPVGAVVGSAVGSVVGGLMGKGAAEAINPTVEDEYWQENHQSAHYVSSDDTHTYDDYAPGYRAGYEGYNRYGSTGLTYADSEADLQRDYETNRGSSNVTWDKAKYAARNAWDKVEGTLPGNQGNEGKDMTSSADRSAYAARLYEERLAADRKRAKR